MGSSPATEKSISDSSLPTRIASMRNSRAVRWYVLALPSRHRGAAKGLQAELDRRLRNGEPAFEYFAPTYVEVREEKGVWVQTARPLLYNYVFVRSSENEIYKMMSTAGLSLYSFLPRVRDGKREYYPYLSDEAMENLRWVARSYADIVPVYTPEPKRLMKGDRVRITEGKFKNAEATVISQPGGGRKDIMVCVENWLWVPLLHVQPGQYEIISLNTDNMHVYTRLNNDRLFGALHEAMQRHHAGGATTEDRALATETLQQYANLRMDSDVTRCKLYALLLPAYTILGDQEACSRMIGEIQGLLPAVRAEQSRALLSVTLYGCTDNCIYREQAHGIIDSWRTEERPKKIKAQLIRRLDDYDEWLGHRR
jgi:transcription antitermination factor NusG